MITIIVIGDYCNYVRILFDNVNCGGLIKCLEQRLKAHCTENHPVFSQYRYDEDVLQRHDDTGPPGGKLVAGARQT